MDAGAARRPSRACRGPAGQEQRRRGRPARGRARPSPSPPREMAAAPQNGSRRGGGRGERPPRDPRRPRLCAPVREAFHSETRAACAPRATPAQGAPSLRAPRPRAARPREDGAGGLGGPPPFAGEARERRSTPPPPVLGRHAASWRTEPTRRAARSRARARGSTGRMSAFVPPANSQ